MKVAVALAGLVLLGTPLVSPSFAGPGGAAELPEDLVRALASQGIAPDDLPAFAPVFDLDLATGMVTVTERPVAEALALAGYRGLAPPASTDDATDSHHVVGDVFHTCFDLVLHCYLFSTNTLAPGTPTRREDLVATYNGIRGPYDATPLRNAVSFPLKGGSVVYVHGVYLVGTHTPAAATNYATPGSPIAGVSVEDGAPYTGGTTHFDHGLFGTGVGRVVYTAVPWGPHVISSGAIRAYGVWNFCQDWFDRTCREDAP